ncbi:MAG: hypothetical protein ACYDBZ_17680 [Steroidobacteraceae bacterium]
MSARRTLFGLCTVLIALGGCGPAESPDATVTIDGVRHACVVALHNEVQGSTVPCSDVAAFLRDELRLAGGSSCDVRAVPDADAAEVARVDASLKAAGYRLIGGPH